MSYLAHQEATIEASKSMFDYYISKRQFKTARLVAEELKDAGYDREANELKELSYEKEMIYEPPLGSDFDNPNPYSDPDRHLFDSLEYEARHAEYDRLDERYELIGE